jgi:hypothetical protein
MTVHHVAGRHAGEKRVWPAACVRRAKPPRGIGTLTPAIRTPADQHTRDKHNQQTHATEHDKDEE